MSPAGKCRLHIVAIVSLVFCLGGCGSASSDDAASPSRPDAPNPPEEIAGDAVSITWFGTAAMLVSDGKTSFMIDPYVSRIDLITVGLGFDLPPNEEMIGEWVERLGSPMIKAVLVSHSHFDHALDAPYFARDTGAYMMGSQSTLNIGRGAGLPETQLKAAELDQTCSIGAFTVQFIESRHGPALFGQVPYPGTIDEPLVPPKPASAYKLGATYAILIKHPTGTILHHGSAGFIPGMYEGLAADVVCLGISGREDTETYLAEVPGKLRPRVLIPIHYDDFFQPLEAGLQDLITAQYQEFMDTANAHSDEYQVMPVPICEPVTILPRS